MKGDCSRGHRELLARFCRMAFLFRALIGLTLVLNVLILYQTRPVMLKPNLLRRWALPDERSRSQRGNERTEIVQTEASLAPNFSELVGVVRTTNRVPAALNHPPYIANLGHRRSPPPRSTPFSCSGFFTVLASAWEPEESCQTLFARPQLREQLALLSAQMVEMKSKLTVFATRSAAERSDARCQICYPNVEVVDFDPEALLARSNFDQRLRDIVRLWPNTVEAGRPLQAFAATKRRADLYRLSLAYETNLSYVDTDIVFLNRRAETFLEEYTSASIWARDQASLEVTNSAFCLGPAHLQRMMKFARVRIAAKDGGKDGKYFYTELGPSLFQHTLLNAPPVRLLSQNHPLNWDLDLIDMQHLEYGHPMLHLTTAIRNHHISNGQNWTGLVLSLLRKLKSPPLAVLTTAVPCQSPQQDKTRAG